MSDSSCRESTFFDSNYRTEHPSKLLTPIIGFPPNIWTLNTAHHPTYYRESTQQILLQNMVSASKFQNNYRLFQKRFKTNKVFYEKDWLWYKNFNHIVSTIIFDCYCRVSSKLLVRAIIGQHELHQQEMKQADNEGHNYIGSDHHNSVKESLDF